MLTFGSLFAGVGGFDIGLEKAGWNCKWQVEWDAHCQQTLSYHWPNVPKWLDVSDASGYELFPVDVITFGSPCQDLSVAGKRAGLDGGRSGLFFQAIRIIKEMQHATGGTFPRWAIWENVPGALSSREGDDFEAVLKEMAGLGASFVEWGILDAQFFGVPQRRRRVFVVACLDPSVSEGSGQQILTVGESVPRNTKKGKQARKDTPGEATASFGSSSFGGWTEQDQSITLSARDYKSASNIVVNDIAPTLRSGGDGGVPSSRGEHLVIQETIHSFDTLFGSNAGVFENISPTLKATQGPPSIAGTLPFTETSFAQYAEGVGTLRASGGTLGGGTETLLVESKSDGVYVLDGTRVDDVRVYDDGMTPTLKSRMGTGGNNVPFLAIPIQDGREIEKKQNGLGIAEEGSPAYTLDQTGAQAVAYSIREDAKANTFSATEIQTARALSALRPSVQSHHAQTFIAEPTMTVRRLTPVECERLMGWPDNHTLHRADGKTNSDTTRYKMTGNGVASPVAQWIAEQINLQY
jgi:DNA (cytosine-5)-methyltransferase 1